MEQPQPSLSKKQLKKQLRKEKMELRKEEHRQQRALDAANRKRQRAAEWESLTEEEREARRQKAMEIRNQRQQQREEDLVKWQAAYNSGPKVVIDMDFDDKMSENEARSVCQQVMYSWSAIKHSDTPIQLSICGLQQNTRLHSILMDKPGIAQWQIPISDVPFYKQHPNTTNVVYLTADSDETISHLEPDKVYIIGGLVDHNHHKGLTLSLAQSKQCSHGKLPLAQFLDLKGNRGKFSRVLTVNHMVGILTKYNETSDWRAAFLDVIPSRKKIAPCSDSNSNATGDEESEGEDAMDELSRTEGKPNPSELTDDVATEQAVPVTVNTNVQEEQSSSSAV